MAQSCPCPIGAANRAGTTGGGTRYPEMTPDPERAARAPPAANTDVWQFTTSDKDRGPIPMAVAGRSRYWIVTKTTCPNVIIVGIATSAKPSANNSRQTIRERAFAMSLAR